MPDPTERFGETTLPGDRSVDETDAPDFTPASHNKPQNRTAWLDMAVLGFVTVLIRIPAFLSSKHLTFDDGVFASSIIAMRDGGVPFRDVFSSQGPLFLPLAYVFDLLGFRTIDSPRVLGVLSGLVITLVTYWCLHMMAGRKSAIFGSLLALTSGCLMWVTGPLAADGPALAFAMITFALALTYNRRPSLRTAVLMGLAVGATLSTKAMEAPILLPVIMVLGAPLLGALRSGTLRARNFLDTVVAALVSAVLFAAISLPFGFSDVWDQSFRYRTEAASARDPLANAKKIISTMWDRDLVIYLFGAATILWGIWTWSQNRSTSAELASSPTDDSPVDDSPVEPASISETQWTPSERSLVISWVVFSALWLVFMVSPMWRPHVSAMIPPLALLLGVFALPRKALYVLGVLSLPLLVIQLDGLLAPGGYSGSEARVVAILEELPPGAWALSDEPGLVWRAGRRTTDNMVDPSMLRVQQGRYNVDTLIADATKKQVCAVVVRSNERFGSFPDLAEKLESKGYEVVDTSRNRVGDDQRVYIKTDCDPLS
ncbi:MAG TPA: hypothetical protein VL068_06175 [Microthrixaceae bacterium]|nr:hypothetical protein [Microthrixaceae bacterium]